MQNTREILNFLAATLKNKIEMGKINFTNTF